MPLRWAIEQIWPQKNTHVGCKLLWSRNCMWLRQMSAHKQSDQEAGLYCPGTCLFRAGIQTAPPSWHFCSPYQQPTSSDPALDNITTNNVREITLLHFLSTFIFQEENLHTTVPTLASCNPGPSLSPSRFTNVGYNFVSKRKPGTWWLVPGTELSEMWINWRKSKTEQQEGPEDTIYEERKKERGLFSLEDRWLWTSNTCRTKRNGWILS